MSFKMGKSAVNNRLPGFHKADVAAILGTNPIFIVLEAGSSGRGFVAGLLRVKVDVVACIRAALSVGHGSLHALIRCEAIIRKLSLMLLRQIGSIEGVLLTRIVCLHDAYRRREARRGVYIL